MWTKKEIAINQATTDELKNEYEEDWQGFFKEFIKAIEEKHKEA